MGCIAYSMVCFENVCSRDGWYAVNNRLEMLYDKRISVTSEFLQSMYYVGAIFISMGTNPARPYNVLDMVYVSLVVVTSK